MANQPGNPERWAGKIGFDSGPVRLSRQRQAPNPKKPSLGHEASRRANKHMRPELGKKGRS